MHKFCRAVLPLLAGLSCVAPVAAHADVGGDVMSFFGKAAKAVKTRVDALPGQVGALPDRLGISRLVDPKAPAAADRIAISPATAIGAEPGAFAAKTELSQLQLPAASDPLVALPEPSVEKASHRFYCAEYVRKRIGMPVLGDAKYWWEKAKALYDRVALPVEDSVMVFATTARLKRGHVAVVTDIVSDREIRVDQANWRNHGEIDHSTPVLDVSRNNDWSLVRVWDVPSHQFGSRTYAISGFIVTAPMRQARAD